MYGKEKDARITFRTYGDVESKIEALAERVKAKKYSWVWNSTMKECTSKSGIISEVMAENITLDEIREKLSEVEDDSNK